MYALIFMSLLTDNTMHIENVELFRSRALCQEYLASLRSAPIHVSPAPPPEAREEAKCAQVQTRDPIVKESLNSLARERHE
jgi:hypothetical protein